MGLLTRFCVFVFCFCFCFFWVILMPVYQSITGWWTLMDISIFIVWSTKVLTCMLPVSDKGHNRHVDYLSVIGFVIGEKLVHNMFVLQAVNLVCDILHLCQWLGLAWFLRYNKPQAGSTSIERRRQKSMLEAKKSVWSEWVFYRRTMKALAKKSTAKPWPKKQETVLKYLSLTFRIVLCSDSTRKRHDLSHPIHADNCRLNDFKQCIKEPPAFVWRDWSAITYLNDDFEGGDFIFADFDQTVQVGLVSVWQAPDSKF